MHFSQALASVAVLACFVSAQLQPCGNGTLPDSVPRSRIHPRDSSCPLQQLKNCDRYDVRIFRQDESFDQSTEKVFRGYLEAKDGQSTGKFDEKNLVRVREVRESKGIAHSVGIQKQLADSDRGSELFTKIRGSCVQNGYHYTLEQQEEYYPLDKAVDMMVYSLGYEEKLAIFSRVSAAVEYVQTYGDGHYAIGDLNPGNILVGNRESGNFRTVKLSGLSGITTRDSAEGSANAVSPWAPIEMVKTGDQYHPQSADVYSVGMLLLFAMDERIPVESPTSAKAGWITSAVSTKSVARHIWMKSKPKRDLAKVIASALVNEHVGRDDIGEFRRSLDQLVK